MLLEFPESRHTYIRQNDEFFIQDIPRQRCYVPER